MTTAAPHDASAKAVRRMIWRTFGRLFLPLMLVLLLVGAPGMLAKMAESVSESYGAQADAAYGECKEILLAYPDGAPREEQERFYQAWLRETALAADSSQWELISLLISLAGLLISPALLVGTNGVILAAMRCQPVCWRDALVTWREFRTALGLEMYRFLLVLLWSLPGLALQLLGRALKENLPFIGLLLALAGALLFFALGCGSQLRYSLAPRLLADGASGSAFDLVAISTGIITWWDVFSLLQVLFPDLLLYAGAHLLHADLLTAVLPAWAAGLGLHLLCLIPLGWLLTGSAAVYLTFRSK
ncbi:MAG: hypothetical protein IJ343_12175 [Clostridia bacterium]|nr:hypothetical protein [Clostridia bacterium]